MFKEMMSKLLAHAHAEQNVLYRNMEKSDDEEARSFAYEGDNEHRIVEQQLEQMSRTRNKMSEQWTAQATVLRELINQHVKKEEGTRFRCARREFDSAALEKLGEQLRRQKEKLLTETLGRDGLAAGRPSLVPRPVRNSTLIVCGYREVCEPFCCGIRS